MPNEEVLSTFSEVNIVAFDLPRPKQLSGEEVQAALVAQENQPAASLDPESQENQPVVLDPESQESQSQELDHESLESQVEGSKGQVIGWSSTTICLIILLIIALIAGIPILYGWAVNGLTVAIPGLVYVISREAKIMKLCNERYNQILESRPWDVHGREEEVKKIVRDLVLKKEDEQNEHNNNSDIESTLAAASEEQRVGAGVNGSLSAAKDQQKLLGDGSNSAIGTQEHLDGPSNVTDERLRPEPHDDMVIVVDSNHEENNGPSNTPTYKSLNGCVFNREYDFEGGGELSMPFGNHVAGELRRGIVRDNLTSFKVHIHFRC
ncbi:hypothetical protein BDQ17DRAFT_1431479 [Cyathus striatus]|nr:hypothetical protein BDQ17DRAFT_1431479 [Cyathus striatus]